MTVRVVRRRLSGWVDPARVFSAVATTGSPAIWLDAGPDIRDGLSYVAVETGAIIEARDFAQQEIQGSLARLGSATSTPGRFSLGLVGWFGYEVGAEGDHVAVTAGAGSTRLISVLSLIEFDHAESQMWHVYCNDSGSRPDVVDNLLSSMRTPGDRSDERSLGKFERNPSRSLHWRHDDASYADLVRVCKQHIHAGDAYQLCLTNMATITPGLTRSEALATYLRLRAENPSHHGAFLSIGDTTLLSSSPEVFLRVSADGTATTKPIKGTRPRGESRAEDASIRAELAENVKEKAENVMIVDLMRNDLGRVAAPGSVVVNELLAVETYANVHQLVSTVSAQLAPGKTALDALEACFPAGSMTGAPKISAMRILNRLESGPRGIYSGAFGYLGCDGGMELAMTIRSMVITDEAILIGSGGGITSDSEPDAEVAEMHLKVAPLLTALGLAGNLGGDD